MKKLFAILLFAIPAFAAVPPDLAELARQIEHFPKEGNDSARLKQFFDLYWTTKMHLRPDLAVYVGYPRASAGMEIVRDELDRLEASA